MKPSAISSGVISLLVALVSSSAQHTPSSQDQFTAAPNEITLDREDDLTKPGSSQESDGLNSYFPWTHKPVCTQEPDQNGDEFCVYTNASFGNGRGISILTTPKIAKDFASLPPFQNPTALLSKGINPDADTESLPWYTSFSPGKGVGMFAARPLQRGDLITAYTPSLLAHIGDLLFTDERESLLRLAVDQLPPARRDAYYDLAKFYHDPDIVAQDVLKANGFNMRVGGLKHPAVFQETSRINHACAPNAQYFLSTDMLVHYVHAARDIEKDEEITIAYAPPLHLHADRQRFFKSYFQFNCTCQRCSPGNYGSHRSVEESDKATQDIVTLQFELSQRTPGSPASVKKAEMLIELYKAEGLEGFLDTAYGYAALTYSSVGSARGATKYAKLAAEATRLTYGFDGVGMERIREWESLARDPVNHGSWRTMKEEL